MKFLQNEYFEQRTDIKNSCKFDRSYGRKRCIRDEGMLELALNNPFQLFEGKELYPSIQAKAARLCFGLVKNHAMIDGNKRLGTCYVSFSCVKWI